MATGGCHCGTVRYEVRGTPKHVALCHCSDCRRSSGAPMVAWVAFEEEALTMLQGDLTVFNSSGSTMRGFCPKCGSGVTYRNEDFLPGIVDIQSATLDDPATFAPQAHIQTADRIAWMKEAHLLPAFEHFPSQ